MSRNTEKPTDKAKKAGVELHLVDSKRESESRYFTAEEYGSLEAALEAAKEWHRKHRERT